MNSSHNLACFYDKFVVSKVFPPQTGAVRFSARYYHKSLLKMDGVIILHSKLWVHIQNGKSALDSNESLVLLQIGLCR